MKKVILLALAMLTILFACNKDVVTSFMPTNQKLMTVEKAQTWFNETEPKTVWTKTEKQEHYKPQWDKAIQLNGAIEVPVMLEDKFITPSSNRDNPKQSGAARLLVASFDGTNIYAAIIKYLPSSKFEGNINDINRDNFREKKFDGMIKLENFDFTDQKVVLIENGELTYFMAKPAPSDGRVTATSRDYEICYETCTGSQGSMGGYTSPLTWVCSGTFCVTRPTDWLGVLGGNGTDINGVPTGQGNNFGGGMNDIGAGILGGGTFSTTNKMCKEAIAPPKMIPAAVGINNLLTQQTGLQSVKVQFETKTTNVDQSHYEVSIDFLSFLIDPAQTAVPQNDIPAVLANVFNLAVNQTQEEIKTATTGWWIDHPNKNEYARQRLGQLMAQRMDVVFHTIRTNLISTTMIITYQSQDMFPNTELTKKYLQGI